jgi:hypothetical protein
MNSFKPYLLPILFLALAVSAVAQQPPAPPAPVITFEKNAVVVSGVTAKGQLVLFGVARELAEDDVATVVRRSQVLTDDDSDGRVRLDLGKDVPFRSVWVAVDLATGQWTTAAPEGYPLRLVGWQGSGIERRATAPSDRVEDARTFAEILLVRPGLGAWQLTVEDGSGSDDDGAADGKIAASLDRLIPVAGTVAPPARFDPTDVVVLIDPNRMELTVVQAGASTAAQAVAR